MPIRGERGQVLLAPGTQLTGQYVRSLAARGYRSVYLLDPIAPELAPNEAVRQETRSRAVELLKSCLARVEGGHGVRVEPLRAVVDALLDDLWSNTEAAYEFAALRSVHDYQLQHAVQSCIYALILGTALGYDRARQRALGLGALLHDVGNVRYPELLRRPGPLTPPEAEALREHTTIGYNLLRRNAEIELLSAHMAFQHHERCDGSGYPRGMTGDQLLDFGKVAAVVDVFDAVTSDRPHRPARSLPEGMALLNELAGSALDGFLVRSLARRIAVYPTGAIVRLESGEVALVTGQTTRGPACPRVRVITDAALQLIEPYELELPGTIPVAALLSDYPGEVRAQLQERRVSPS